MATMDVRSLSRLNPELEILLSKSKPLPHMRRDINQIRAGLKARNEALAAMENSSALNVSKQDTTIDARDGHCIPARIYKPHHERRAPLVLMFHGGGFVMGGLEMEDANCCLFCDKLGCVCVCVNVDYRLAPEHPFPAAPNDAWDATQWAAANASQLGADLSLGFVIGGTSAGGNLADVVGHLARDESLSPPITGLLEVVPMLLPNSVVPAKYQSEYISYEQNRNAPTVDQHTYDYFMSLYAPDNHSHLFASFNHPGGHKGLPPVFLQVCGMDTLRDEAIIYEKLLRMEAGVETKIKIYPGLPHGFWVRFPSLQSSKEFAQDTLQGLQWLLEQGRR